jgi:hypothetical protein
MLGRRRRWQLAGRAFGGGGDGLDIQCGKVELARAHGTQRFDSGKDLLGREWLRALSHCEHAQGVTGKTALPERVSAHMFQSVQLLQSVCEHSSH